MKLLAPILSLIAAVTTFSPDIKEPDVTLAQREAVAEKLAADKACWCHNDADLEKYLSATAEAAIPSRAQHETLGSQEKKEAKTKEQFVNDERPWKEAVTVARAYGNRDLRLATALEDLGGFYVAWHKFEEAKKTLQEAVKVREQAIGLEHPDLVYSLEALGQLLLNMPVRGFQAKSSYSSPHGQIQTTPIAAPQTLGTNITLTTIDTSRVVKAANGKRAELLFRRALAIREKTSGPADAGLIDTLQGLRSALRYQGKEGATKEMTARIDAFEKRAYVLIQQGNSLAREGQYTEAEPLYKESLAILERVNSPEYVDVGKVAVSLALLYSKQEKYNDSEQFFQRAIPILEKYAGTEQAVLIFALEKYADLLRKTNRVSAAEKLEAQASALRSGKN